MWKNWVNGVLGLFVILVPFINFSLAVERTVLILLGIIIAVLGFWGIAGEKKVELGEVQPLPPQKPQGPAAVGSSSAMSGPMGMQ
ncbi:MAG: hypothetical protein AAB378_01830 [Patescibacteria group bacterium]